MKTLFGAMGLLLVMVLAALVSGDVVWAQAGSGFNAADVSDVDVELKQPDLNTEEGKLEFDKAKEKAETLKGVTMTKAETTDLMKGSKSCIQEKWTPMGVCCKICCNSSGCWCCITGTQFDISYWEASEIIEVSCRTGYSMIAPGKVPTRGGGETALQSCQGFNKPGNSRWFFEARVWAINGQDGGLRHQGAGGADGERMRKCTLQAGDDLPWPPSGLPGNIPNGYGVKWQKFTRGAQNGPAGSWEAYMSDKDPAWATSGGGVPPQQKACKIGGVDMEACWGPVTANGWVSHPNPKVAAALVAWRAHQKALAAKKVSPAGSEGKFKMAMEYPWPTYSGEFGASMGMPNGGKKGSGCFDPGDSGPEWFGGKKPEEIPAFIAGLEKGEVTTVAEVNPGVYLFTVWVDTKCRRYKTSTGKPTEICHYKNGS